MLFLDRILRMLAFVTNSQNRQNVSESDPKADFLSLPRFLTALSLRSSKDISYLNYLH